MSTCFPSFPAVGVDVMQLSQPRKCRTCSTQFADILLEVFAIASFLDIMIHSY